MVVAIWIKIKHISAGNTIDTGSILNLALKIEQWLKRLTLSWTFVDQKFQETWIANTRRCKGPVPHLLLFPSSHRAYYFCLISVLFEILLMTYWQKLMILLVLKQHGANQFDKFNLIELNKQKLLLSQVMKQLSLITMVKF